MNVWRPVELALTYGARLAWPAFQAVNRQFDSRPFQPKWAPRPLMKSSERTKPQLGWPRTTDSLCPTCVRETRARILSGEQSIETLVDEHVGEIKAHILERDGKVIIEKTCPHARHLHRHAGDQLRRSSSASRACSRARLRRRHRRAAQPRHARRSSTAAARC